jgi:hypothetical protein
MPPFRVALFLDHARAFDLRMIFSENRSPLFRIVRTIVASAVLNRARNFAVMDGADVVL